jgi:signal recognition particle receptor subunit beta
MSFINYSSREINCKLVYYGPGLGGKTTNLQFIYARTSPEAKGKMISLATETERTLFFDFLPLSLGEIRGFKTRFHLYTVPGQVFYDASRKLILKGVDGVVFVADSQNERMEANMESLENLRLNLTEQGYNLDKLPYIIQYNKRDLPNAAPLDELRQLLNPAHAPEFEACATTGVGVFETLKAIAKAVLTELRRGGGGGSGSAAQPMTSTFLGARHAIAFAGVVLALAGSTRAAEQDDGTLNKVVELNKKALALYEALDMEGAAATLGQALDLCTSAKLDSHPTAARTHIHLGVVYVSGLKNREQGLAEFRKALAIDAKIKITKSLINPEVQDAFAEAQAVATVLQGGARPLPFPTGQEVPMRTTPAEGLDYEINHPTSPRPCATRPLPSRPRSRPDWAPPRSCWPTGLKPATISGPRHASGRERGKLVSSEDPGRSDPGQGSGLLHRGPERRRSSPGPQRDARGAPSPSRSHRRSPQTRRPPPVRRRSPRQGR